MTTPKVFVSYSHDSDEHKMWVLRLASILTEKYGIDVTLDQWDIDLGDDLPKFMERIVAKDKVLMICTPTYVHKCNEVERGGVYTEKRLMSGELYKGKPINSFIPVIRGRSQDFGDRNMPNFLGQGSYYLDMSDEAQFDENALQLAASIHGARTRKPVIGENPFEKGFDVSFGVDRDGTSLIRNRELDGIALYTDEGNFLTLATQANRLFVLKHDEFGILDEEFERQTASLSEESRLSNGYGLERQNAVLFGKHIYYTEEANPCTVIKVSIFDADDVELKNFDYPVMISSEGKMSQTVVGEKKHILLPDINEIVEIGDFPTQGWYRLKRIGKHLYVISRNNRQITLGRYLIGSGRDKSFGNDGEVVLTEGGSFSHHCNDILETADGKIVAAGSGNQGSIISLNPDGSLNGGFGNRGRLDFTAKHRSTANALFEFKDHFYVVGEESDGNSIHNCYLGSFTEDGKIRHTFGDEGSYSIANGTRDRFIDAVIVSNKVTILHQHNGFDSIGRRRICLARLHLK